MGSVVGNAEGAIVSSTDYVVAPGRPHSTIAVASWLVPELFYLEKHATIYEAMLACANRREPPHLATVAAELRRMKRLDLVGGCLRPSS
jgi:replicative DNA helicase